MKRTMLALLVNFWASTQGLSLGGDVYDAARTARNSLHVVTDSAHYLKHITLHTKKGVKLYIVADITEARRSGQIKPLFQRIQRDGGEMWVTEMPPGGTTVVADGISVVDKGKHYWGSTPGSAYVENWHWHKNRARTYPVK